MLRYLFILVCIALVGCQATARYRAADHSRGDSSRLDAFVAEWLGTPYNYGGMSKNGVDCSGFVVILMREIYGIKLPRSSQDQYSQGYKIARGRLRKGDLVFFNIVPKRGVDHVGFYLGGDRFIHASTNAGVIISQLGEDYYQKCYYGACRYF
jgi:cell wall-associated NlpC family hydrolase